MNQMLKQAQALQRKLLKAQEELAQRDVEGTAGGGMVTAVVAGGGGEVRRLEIAAEAVDPEDVEMLQDMVVAAVNEALRKAKDLEQELIGGLGLPPGLM